MLPGSRCLLGEDDSQITCFRRNQFPVRVCFETRTNEREDNMSVESRTWLTSWRLYPWSVVSCNVANYKSVKHISLIGTKRQIGNQCQLNFFSVCKLLQHVRSYYRFRKRVFRLILSLWCIPDSKILVYRTDLSYPELVAGDPLMLDHLDYCNVWSNTIGFA